MNATLGHLHTIRQGLKLTRGKLPDTDLEDKIKINKFAQPWTLVQKRWGVLLRSIRTFPHHIKHRK